MTTLTEIYLRDILKTKSSKSRVEISNKMVSYLERWFEYNPYELVVCDIKGGIIHPPTFGDWINRVSKELGIDFHFHMLRHTYATELMMNGVNPVVVKKLLRHSDVNTTWNVYTHPQYEDQHETLDEVYADKDNEVKFDINLNICLKI